MPNLIDLSAFSGQCRITPDVIENTFEDVCDVLEGIQTFRSVTINFGTGGPVPSVINYNFTNTDTVRTIRGLVICSANVGFIQSTTTVVYGHRLTVDGGIVVDGLVGTEAGFNIAAPSDEFVFTDKVLPPIIWPVAIAPGANFTAEYLVDRNPAFFTGTVALEQVESQTFSFIGGF